MMPLMNGLQAGAVPAVPSMPLPSPPSLPSLPSLPSTLPSLPSLPPLPSLSDLQSSLQRIGIKEAIPTLPTLPVLPTFALPHIDTPARLSVQAADALRALGLPDALPIPTSQLDLGAALDVLKGDPLLLAPAAQVLLVSLVALVTAYQLPPPSSSPVGAYGRSGSYSEIYSTSGKYNPQDAAEYFSRRPVVTSLRALELGLASASFGLSILLDKLQGKLADARREAARAAQLTALLTKLGPTFIKIGQSLSIRTDLLRPAYLKSLSQLQDSVPAFPTEEAIRIMQQELSRARQGDDGEGKKATVLLEDVFSDLSPSSSVIAAASLGQVYKARMRDTGAAVAIKVQRPDIEERVALDMHLLRSIVQPIKQIFGLQSNVLGIVDDWGYGFVAELDYLQEAQNSRDFMRSIMQTPLKDAVFAPTVIASATTKRILTTEWIDGERLELGSSADRSAMCKLAMNTYLTMMLETPVLHADPHPGNLRRTPDGKLCILDWGLVTSLAPDLQGTMIDHIAHLTSRDYAKVPTDLVKLGFIPAGMEQAAAEGGVVEVLADVYGKWAMGGGAARVDINAVIQDLSGLTDRYGNLFQLPPYFAYIAKAFGVLEGIGLTNDPNYAIVGECLPYVSKRLLSKADDRTEESLRSFIFGSATDGIVDADRLELLIRGFDSFGANKGKIVARDDKPVLLGGGSSSGGSGGSISATTSSSTTSPPLGSAGNKGAVRVQQIEDAAESIAQLLLDGPSSSSSSSSAYRPTPLQKILIEELVKYASAVTRLSGSRLREASGRLPTGRTLLGTLIDPLGLFTGGRLVEPDDKDFRVIDAAERVVGLFVEMLNEGQLLDRQGGAAIIGKVVQKGGSISSSPNLAPNPDASSSAAIVRQQLSQLLLSLSPQQSVDVALRVGRKVYDRRDGVRGMGMLFGRTFLEQAAGRVRL